MRKLLTILTMFLLVVPVTALLTVSENVPCQPCEFDSDCTDIIGEFDYHCIRGRCQTMDFSSECAACQPDQEKWECEIRGDKVISVHKTCKSTGYGYMIEERNCLEGCVIETGRCREDREQIPDLMPFLQNYWWLIAIAVIVYIIFKKKKNRS